MNLKRPPLRESVIEKKVKMYARLKGWTVRKFTSPGKKFVSDNIFMRYPGRAFFIEFKRPGQKSNKGQQLEHGEMRNCGFSVYVIDNIGEGMEAVDKETENNG